MRKNVVSEFLIKNFTESFQVFYISPVKSAQTQIMDLNEFLFFGFSSFLNVFDLKISRTEELIVQFEGGGAFTLGSDLFLFIFLFYLIIHYIINQQKKC